MEALLVGHGTSVSEFGAGSFPILGGRPVGGMSGSTGDAPCFHHIWASGLLMCSPPIICYKSPNRK